MKQKYCHFVTLALLCVPFFLVLGPFHRIRPSHKHHKEQGPASIKYLPTSTYVHHHSSAESEWPQSKSSDDLCEALNLLCRLGTFSPHFGPFHFPSSDARRPPPTAGSSPLFVRTYTRCIPRRPCPVPSLSSLSTLPSLSLSSSNWSTPSRTNCECLPPASSSSYATNPPNQSAESPFAFHPRKFPLPIPRIPFLGTSCHATLSLTGHPWTSLTLAPC